MLGPATKRILTRITGLIPLFFVCQAQAALEDLRIVAVSEADGRAVIQTKNGDMQSVKAGDRLPGSDAVVREIWGKRLVAEETMPGNPQRKQLVWITRDGKGNSRVQRLRRERPEESLTVPTQGTRVFKAGADNNNQR